MRRLFLPALALLTVFLPSCAYMQTHKNIEEAGRRYKGYQLEKPTQLLRSDGTWYIAATPAEYRLKHDIIHDNVFRKTNEPTMELQATQPGTAYHALSAHTATVLLRADGYAESHTLAREITQNPGPWLTSLPHATPHRVKAHIAGEENTAITYAPTPEKLSPGYRILSGLDLVVVDVPGTLLYNVAVPFIAPFVFFHEFLSE